MMRRTLSLLPFFVVACSDDAALKGRAVETKPEVRRAMGADASSMSTAGSILNAKFQVKFTTKDGFLIKNSQVCDGEASIAVAGKNDGSYGFSMDNPQLKCLGDLVDLGSLLSGLTAKASDATPKTSTEPPTPLDSVKTVPSFQDGVLYLNKTLGAVWNPPRPMLVGPLIQDPTKYAGLDRTTQHTLTTMDGQDLKESTGTIQVKVEEVNAVLPMNLPPDKQLGSLIHWSLRSKDFPKVKRANLFVLDEFHIWMSMRPLAVAKIRVVSGYDDLIGGGAVKGFGGLLLGALQGIMGFIGGKAEVELDIVDWETR